jgi:hypothetical protein
MDTDVLERFAEQRFHLAARAIRKWTTFIESQPLCSLSEFPGGSVPDGLLQRSEVVRRHLFRSASVSHPRSSPGSCGLGLIGLDRS